MPLKKELVVDNWNTLVENGAGRAKQAMDAIETKINAANIPRVRVGQREVSGSLFGTKRNFLIVANEGLPEFFLYICARDYGIHLDISWYLTIQPRGYKQMFSRYKTGSPTALSMRLGVFRQQDATAFVTAVHHCVTQQVKELLENLNLAPQGLNTQSKGFLAVW